MSKHTATLPNDPDALSIINYRLYTVEKGMGYLCDRKNGVYPPLKGPSAVASTFEIMRHLRLVLLRCELSSAAIRAELEALRIRSPNRLWPQEVEL